MPRGLRIIAAWGAVFVLSCAAAPTWAAPTFDAKNGALNGGNSSAEDVVDDPQGSPSSSEKHIHDEPPPVYVTSRELGVDSQFTCGDLHDSSSDLGGLLHCGGANRICVAADAVSADGEGYLASETVRVDTRSGTASEELLGFECQQRGGVLVDAAEPVVITVTREDFASMPVKPLVASAGPERGWLPVNMVNVLYAEQQTQTLPMELLGTPVEVRAVPVLYEWDLGDGNTISTTNPGDPYPAETISGTYSGEGWYDVTLTTTFSGQFSVAGGPWQDIDGTIEVASDPIPLYSKSLESRLVNGDIPVDEDEDPWIPERTAATEGPRDPEATHREI